MKKTISNIRTLAALLMAGAAFAACSSSDDIINEQPVKQGYTLTVSASKDGNATRALTDDNGAIVASWETTDEIVVTKNGTEVGTLSPTNISGLTATFTGTISGDADINVNDVLTLTYHPIASLSDFASQDGTLNGLATSAENFDMAMATVTISEINGKNIIVSESSANFVNQTAVVVLTPSRRAPWNSDEVQYFNISSLTILATMTIPNVGAVTEQIGPITVSGDYPYYFSLPSKTYLADLLAAKYSLSASAISALLNSATISFAGFIGQLPYNPSYLVCSKTGYKFAAGKYYKLDVSNFAMDILMKATVDGKDVYYDGSQSYWSNTVTLPINSVAGWKVEGNYNYVFCGDKQLYMENTSEGTEDWVRAFDGFMSWGATYSLREPAGDPDLSTLTISGHTFSYQAGQTWEKAIKYYPVENAGWTIYNGTWDLVRYGDLQLYDSWGNEILVYDTIDPDEAYYLQ